MSDEIVAYDTTPDLYTPSQYSSFQSPDASTKKMIVNAINSAESLAQHEGETLEVVGVFTKPGIRRSRVKGQADQPCTNTTLVCADGSAYFSQSEGVRNAADSFMAAGLFDSGEIIRMHLEARTLPNGNTRKTLVLD